MSKLEQFSWFHDKQKLWCSTYCAVYHVYVLFQQGNFLPYLDLFQKESVKVEACKAIIEAFLKGQKSVTPDPLIVNTLLAICKQMHDSLKWVCSLLSMDQLKARKSFFKKCYATFEGLCPS